MDANPTGAHIMAGLIRGFGMQARVVAGIDEAREVIESGSQLFDFVITGQELLDATRSEIVSPLNQSGLSRLTASDVAVANNRREALAAAPVLDGYEQRCIGAAKLRSAMEVALSRTRAGAAL